MLAPAPLLGKGLIFRRSDGASSRPPSAAGCERKRRRYGLHKARRRYAIGSQTSKAPKRIYICCDRGIKRQVCLHTGFAAIHNCSRSSYGLRIKRFLGLRARIWACRRVTNGLRLTLLLGFTFLGNPEQFVTCSLLRGCKRREY